MRIKPGAKRKFAQRRVFRYCRCFFRPLQHLWEPRQSILTARLSDERLLQNEKQKKNFRKNQDDPRRLRLLWTCCRTSQRLRRTSGRTRHSNTVDEMWWTAERRRWWREMEEGVGCRQHRSWQSRAWCFFYFTFHHQPPAHCSGHRSLVQFDVRTQQWSSSCRQR